METILVVDDEKNYLLVMEALLTDQGYEVLTADSGASALKLLDQDLDLILTDMTMPKMDGIELLSRAKASRPDLPVIMMTAHGTVDKAVEAMKKGAFDYITKPFKNEDLMRAISKALEMRRLQRENQALSQALRERHSFGNIIGKSKVMLDVYRLIEKVAGARANVLVTGESGTGKELIAKALHYNSPRSGGPFVAVNCSALAETLLESELFGHEKGAFTDARATRKGRFELAHGGTLFLDEIGEMSQHLQAKLLRVLQERRFERVGGNETIETDVRVIAATNRDLKQEVAAGRFREDLFYRLNVVHIAVPPLRDRKDDIPLLASHFIRKYGLEARKPDLGVAPETMRRLYGHQWPGNVRELENVIERAVILCSGDTLLPEDLPEGLGLGPTGGEMNGGFAEKSGAGTVHRPEPAIMPPAGGGGLDIDAFIDPGLPLNEVLEAIEKKMIRRALVMSDGVQAKAAERLGIAKNLMQYKLKKYPPEALREAGPFDLDIDRFLPPNQPLNDALDLIEKKMIVRALEQAGGSQARAADLLGVTQRVVQYKVKKYGLE